MFIFLDTETTDRGPADRLCQIAFKTLTRRKFISLFQLFGKNYSKSDFS
jgi:hypothetical protein